MTARREPNRIAVKSMRCSRARRRELRRSSRVRRPCRGSSKRLIRQQQRSEEVWRQRSKDTLSVILWLLRVSGVPRRSGKRHRRADMLSTSSSKDAGVPSGVASSAIPLMAERCSCAARDHAPDVPQRYTVTRPRRLVDISAICQPNAHARTRHTSRKQLAIRHIAKLLSRMT